MELEKWGAEGRYSYLEDTLPPGTSASVKMTLPSHRYYQPPNLGRVNYGAQGRVRKSISYTPFVFYLLLRTAFLFQQHPPLYL